MILLPYPPHARIIDVHLMSSKTGLHVVRTDGSCDLWWRLHCPFVCMSWLNLSCLPSLYYSTLSTSLLHCSLQVKLLPGPTVSTDTSPTQHSRVSALDISKQCFERENNNNKQQNPKNEQTKHLGKNPGFSSDNRSGSAVYFNIPVREVER